LPWCRRQLASRRGTEDGDINQSETDGAELNRSGKKRIRKEWIEENYDHDFL
jgi:hypothetical protein